MAPGHRGRLSRRPLALGRRYATEAAGACLAWAVAERPERLVAIVDTASAASARVLEKIGMRPSHRLPRAQNGCSTPSNIRGALRVPPPGRIGAADDRSG